MKRILSNLPLNLPPGIKMVVLSGPNRGLRWITGTGPTRGCWVGNYEHDQTASLHRFIRPGNVAYDIGANAGYYTLAFSRMVGPTGRVFAFEPESRNVSNLRKHIRINHLENVTVVQMAVSDRKDMLGFEVGVQASGKFASSSSYVVPTISVDEFIAAGNPAPAFLKMDIEGAEIMGLSGARNLLAQRSATLMIEAHSVQLWVECMALIRSYGYRITDFDGQLPPADRWEFLAFPQ